MSSPAAIAAKVALGYAKAGSKLGEPHSLYRPTDRHSAAIAPGNLIKTFPFASTATPDNSFSRPSRFNEYARYGLFDQTGTQPGDYIDGPTGTFFLASLQPLEPLMVVSCNAVVRIARPAGIQPGLSTNYGGRTDATDVPEIVDWPASLQRGGVSESGRSGVPGDPKRFAGAICRMPVVPEYVFRAGDRLTVDNGDTWMISGAFLQSQGWELSLSSIEA